MKTIKLPLKYLDECFIYRSTTGILLWNTRPRKHFSSLHAWITWNNRYAGTVAGSPNKDGRKWLTLKNVGRILVARIAWTLYYRKDPGARQVDHKDTNPSNDKIRNLRLASHSENQHNKRLNRNNVSGFKGVSFDKRRGVFVAFLKLDRKNIYCGSFATAEEANVHLTKVRKSMHKKFANQGQTGVTLPRT